MSPQYILSLCLLLTLCLSTDQFHHNCIHSKLQYENSEIPSIESPHSSERNLAESPKTKGFNPALARPIRIKTDTSALSSIPPPLKLVIEQLLEVAKNFFTKRIKVMPQNSPIKFPGTMSRCQTADIPEKHLKEGVVDADLILYVTALNEPRDTYLAWATSCLMGDESTNFRPIAGQINFNSARIKEDIKMFEKQIDTTLHEMTHVLALSPRLYGLFRTKSGERLGYDNTKLDIKFRGVETSLLITPKLMEVAKAFYKCDKVKGIELENEGGFGSRGAHFERAMLNNEMMTSSLGSESSYSVFTLALLEDSGWYSVDYSLAEPFSYGKNRGCSFLENACKDPNKPREYCYDDAPLCSFSYYQKAYCFKRDDFADKCGYTSTMDSDSKDCRVFQEPRKINIYAESFGPHSKCVNSNYSIAGWSSSEDPVRCMEYKCQNNKIVFFISGKEIGICSKEKEILNAPKGYQGQLECPDPEAFCESHYLKCSNFCSGKGYCFRGECECIPGYSGVDCGTKA